MIIVLNNTVFFHMNINRSEFYVILKFILNMIFFVIINLNYLIIKFKKKKHSNPTFCVKTLNKLWKISSEIKFDFDVWTIADFIMGIKTYLKHINRSYLIPNSL